ncbi:proline-rich protein HaeIII subfamily 1-like [Bos indicus x Bos taurus]|uniref:proline-rich protein HaeIII subfamily 1-like n=1 Tax=Bos indicus x Bos taurus TaxID=30522 RepID=UPI000F7D20E7|nr:proline-rich protein HaeIII subfamily 1-like [Bos indicus x Bos taurus]
MLCSPCGKKANEMTRDFGCNQLVSSSEHRITLLVAGKLPSAQVLLPSREERRKVGSQLSAAASPHSWSGLCGQRPPALGQQSQVAACAPEAWPVPAHGVQSPGRRGAPGAAGLCSSNPGEGAHPLTLKREPPGGPAQRHAGDSSRPDPGRGPSVILGPTPPRHGRALKPAPRHAPSPEGPRPPPAPGPPPPRPVKCQPPAPLPRSPRNTSPLPQPPSPRLPWPLLLCPGLHQQGKQVSTVPTYCQHPRNEAGCLPPGPSKQCPLPTEEAGPCGLGRRPARSPPLAYHYARAPGPRAGLGTLLRRQSGEPGAAPKSPQQSQCP